MMPILRRLLLSLVLLSAGALTLLLSDLYSREGARKQEAAGRSAFPVAVLKHSSNPLLDEIERVPAFFRFQPVPVEPEIGDRADGIVADLAVAIETTARLEPDSGVHEHLIQLTRFDLDKVLYPCFRRRP